LEFNLDRTGRNGLPCGLLADWNDCLKLGFNGESLFVAFQVYLGLKTLAEIAEQIDRPADKAWAEAQMEPLLENIQAHTWDGDWFIWAIAEDGTVYGTHEFEEGQVYLNTQVWSVISGAATEEQARRCMQTVNERLATDYGLMLCAPPFVKTSVEVMRSVVFNPGIKENAGIFNHTQGWGIMAECMLGHGDRAYDYLRAAMPAAYNTRAEVRQSEPYVQGQTTYSRFSPREGNTRTSWLTGAAAWFYFSVTHYVLGIRPELDGLRIDPCIPSEWEGFSVKRVFRGKTLEIQVHNPNHVQRGVEKMTLNGEEIKGNLVPIDKMASTNRVEVWLG
jgi:N,N'-diacetylchitobiose phosphorylase